MNYEPSSNKQEFERRFVMSRSNSRETAKKTARSKKKGLFKTNKAKVLELNSNSEYDGFGVQSSRVTSPANIRP